MNRFLIVVLVLAAAAAAQARPISEVRQNNSQGEPLLKDSTVTVCGVVTEVGHFGYYGPAFMQDATGGVMLNQANVSSGLSIGDSVTVTGTVDQYCGRTQLIDFQTTNHGSAGVPVPLQFEVEWVDDIDTTAGYVENEGWLVRFDSVEIAHSSGQRFDEGQYDITDPSGHSSKLYIDKDAGELMGMEIPDGYISLTGLVSQHIYDPPYFGAYQVMPRTAADLGQTVEYTPIGEAIEDLDGDRIPDRLGQSVTITGVATVPSGVFNTEYLDIYVQDHTGGVNVFSFDYDSVALGDSVVVSGEVDCYRGKTEVSGATVTVAGQGTVPEPRVLTCADINEEAYEGELVQLEDITTDAYVLEGNANYDVEDQSGITTMRIDRETDIPGMALSAAPFTLVGIKSQYAYDTVNLDDGYQITPRFRTDFAGASETLPLLTIAEVQRPGPDGVTPVYFDSVVRVRGRLTGPASVFTSGSNNSLYIEDETQGVNVYGCNCSPAEEVFVDSLGVEWEVVGTVTEYNGLTEIADGSMWVSDSSPVPVVPRRVPYNSSLTEGMESDLVTVVGDVIQGADRSGSGYNLVIKNGSAPIAVRVNDNAGIDITPYLRTPGRRVRFTGIVGQYDYEAPYSTGYQLMPRFNSDIVDTTGAYPPAEAMRIDSIGPNPFSPALGQAASVRVNSPSDYRLTVTVFDLKGRAVRELLREGAGGCHELVWDGTDDLARALPAGIYLVNLKGVGSDGEVRTVARPVVIAVKLD